MKIVIIGAGPAGITAAETVRQFDDQAQILMISDEPFPPYSPPALIEYFSSGQEIHFWKGKDFTHRLNIEYRAGNHVTAVVPKENAFRLSDGKELSYDRLVIATGGRLYAPVEGSDKAGIYNFKSLSAAERLLDQIKKKDTRSALIVGAGFIGVEIALLLRNMGLDVTMLEKVRVMGNILDTETSEIVLKMLKERGINVMVGPEAEAVTFLGDTWAEAVKLKSGEEVRADILIAATGIKPNIEFLKGSGIETNWGVLVNENLLTSVQNIYAAGDVAETIDRITGDRYVHAIFPNAIAQGKIVGYNLLGWNMIYEGSESMNSLRHLGLPIFSAGHIEGEELCRRGNGVLRKIFIKDDRIVGFRFAGDVSAAGIFRSLMNKKAHVGSYKHLLLEPGFGIGMIEGLAISAV